MLVYFPKNRNFVQIITVPDFNKQTKKLRKFRAAWQVPLHDRNDSDAKQSTATCQ